MEADSSGALSQIDDDQPVVEAVEEVPFWKRPWPRRIYLTLIALYLLRVLFRINQLSL